MKPFVLETGRLLLRQWRQDDFAPFAALNADARVMAHFPALLTPRQSDALGQRCAGLIAQQGWGFWAVEHKVQQRFIGMVGLHRPSADLPFSPCVEVGWRLVYDAWGQGYAQEAANAALQAGFTMLGFDEIVAFTTVGNVRSQAVMARLGMVCSPQTFLHPALPACHVLAEHCLYRLPKACWINPQAALIHLK